MSAQGGSPITPAEAWTIFDGWKKNRREIGILLCGKSGTVSTMGTVSSARNGTLRFASEAAGASFNLREAEFRYGPVTFFPRWPAPPPVDVIAVQAMLSSGDWLVMAEGVSPDMLAPRALPEPS